jgi:hypothetical protein|tara:strand:- start:606 stop:788 length:183 start_codon:yes stop_codon:yes gene_type:complete
MSDKNFDVTMQVTVSKDNNILSSHEESHSDDVKDLVSDTFYDVDDVEVSNVIVKERELNE